MFSHTGQHRDYCTPCEAILKTRDWVNSRKELQENNNDKIDRLISLLQFVKTQNQQFMPYRNIVRSVRDLVDDLEATSFYQ